MANISSQGLITGPQMPANTTAKIAYSLTSRTKNTQNGLSTCGICIINEAQNGKEN